MKGFTLYLTVILTLPWTVIASQSENKAIAHSHNDYQQEQPLTTALEQGFQSIEIDILLHERQLIVTHNSFYLSQKPTIEELYFDPLIKLIDSDISLQWLLIDFKDYSAEIIDQLHDSVLKYKDLFLSRTNNYDNGPLQIILSGNIPRTEIANNPKYEYFFLDGRISDLENPEQIKYTPMISSNITTLTSWQRNHCLKKGEIETIKILNNKIQALGIKLRFWNTEDNVIIWNQLLDIGVEVISVDDLVRFKEYRQLKIIEP